MHLNALTGKVLQIQTNIELDFRAADEKELQGIAKNGTFGRMVTESEVKSGGADIVDTKMVREQKKDGTLKSRLCLSGMTTKMVITRKKTATAILFRIASGRQRDGFAD